LRLAGVTQTTVQNHHFEKIAQKEISHVVDHHRSSIFPVVAWLFWLQSHPQLSKNRQCCSRPAGDRDHPSDLKPVAYYLDPLFIKNRKVSQAG
jgi:hypothetical protein